MKPANASVFQKFKNASKLNHRQDAEGNETKVEVREDEEQSVKLQEIIELLVAAGYFRARIKGLSTFDKVVGGLTWCIESCNIDVDVDLLFQENSTIGQKIALTEKIVAVLPKLKCPLRIEPHQIQGLDFIHIFPVIQWLVKRSMEFRQEMSTFVRSYAVKQFNKNFGIETIGTDKKKKAIQNVNVVQELYRPRRYYKCKNEPPTDLLSRIEVTLLEYGARGDLRQKSAPNEASEDSVTEEEEFEHRNLEQLLANMTIRDEANETVILDAEDEKLLRRHYELLQHEIEDGSEKSKSKRQKLVLRQQKELLEEKSAELISRKEELEKKLLESNSKLESTRNKLQQANTALAELQKNENKNPDTVKEVEELVILSGNLRTQELQFREFCKQELARLKTQIEEAKTVSPSEPLSNNKSMEEELEKQRLLRLQLAKKNRITACLQRQLDDVPNRAELAQYQRRFLELYNQVAMKHKETKQYYTLYNTLADTRLYLSKELSLLNSISENYLEVLVTPNAKDEFLSQLESVLDAISQTRKKVEVRLGEEKRKRDELSRSLQALIEQQRKYVAAVRQLSIECKRHENLLVQYRQ